ARGAWAGCACATRSRVPTAAAATPATAGSSASTTAARAAAPADRAVPSWPTDVSTDAAAARARPASTASTACREPASATARRLRGRLVAGLLHGDALHPAVADRVRLQWRHLHELRSRPRGPLRSPRLQVRPAARLHARAALCQRDLRLRLAVVPDGLLLQR